LRYMRRKLEYLLRNCATHAEGCAGGDSLGGDRVVEVQRIENHGLWEAYSRCLAEQQHELASCWREAGRSKPVNCSMDEDFEGFLFHGTSHENVESIARAGFAIYSHDTSHLRYGACVYFSDESCKVHQYSACVEKADGSQVFCMLFCSVNRTRKENADCDSCDQAARAQSV